MNTSGEAADQVMRMMLNGTEVLLKLTGSGAKMPPCLFTLWQSNKTRPRVQRGLKICSVAVSP